MILPCDGIFDTQPFAFVVAEYEKVSRISKRLTRHVHDNSVGQGTEAQHLNYPIIKRPVSVLLPPLGIALLMKS